jgi:tetratricopeptide (TPR) repeat protein
MTRTRILLVTVATALASVVALLGGVLGDVAPPAAATGRPPVEQRTSQELLGELLTGIEDGKTDRYVRRLEQRAAGHRGDADTLTLLGFGYQQRARETADPAYYDRSEYALRRAGELGGDASLVNTGLATLAVSRHRFRAAIRLARRALRADGENAAAYGALGDGLANIGRYREAFRAFDRMAELSPSIASYARVAYARELLGRPRAAEEAAELALELNSSIPEHVAATLVQLGTIRLNAGQPMRARAAFSQALRSVPGNLRAEAGLARVEAASGRYVTAVKRLRRVVAALPLPEYAIWLGDALTAAGRSGDARRAYALVETIERLFAANGVRTDLQTAVFDLDHGRRPADALRRARRAYDAGPSIQAADVLAWGLVRNGRCRDARRYSERALRLGTLDGLMFFHRGMIERCLGREEAAGRWFARALDTNPHFSLIWAPVARRYAS